MFGKNDENIFPLGSYIFNFLIRDGLDKKLIDKDHVKIVYTGIFLQQVVGSFQSLNFINNNDKLKVRYCEYLLFLTYSKENLNAETLLTLSKLAVYAEKIVIEMDGGRYAVNIKIENLEEFDSLNNKQKSLSQLYPNHERLSPQKLGATENPMNKSSRIIILEILLKKIFSRLTQ
jgi:hypothetical protein